MVTLSIFLKFEGTNEWEEKFNAFHFPAVLLIHPSAVTKDLLQTMRL